MSEWRSVETGGDTYYFNETTGETSWQLPTAPGQDIVDKKRTKSGGVKSAKALHLLQTQKTDTDADTAVADIDGVAMVALNAAGGEDVEIAFEEDNTPASASLEARSTTAPPTAGAKSAAATISSVHDTSKPHRPTKKTGWFNKSMRSFNKSIKAIGGTHETKSNGRNTMIVSVVLASLIGVYALWLAAWGSFFDWLSPMDGGASTADVFLGMPIATQGVTGTICGVLFVFTIYTIRRVTCRRRSTLESFKTEYETRGASKWRIVRAYQLFQWAKGPNSPHWGEFTLAKEGIETGLQIINVAGCVGEKRQRGDERAPELKPANWRVR